MLTQKRISALFTLICSVLLIVSFNMGGLKAQNWSQPDLQQDRFAFDQDFPVDESIPSPADFLGYELGDRMTLYHQVVAYANKLAESSVRVKIGEYGYTHEGRPLVYLVITHAENQSRLEEIRLANLKLSDPMNTSATEAEEIMKSNPVVVSHSYNIHGNEASSTEAAMQVAWRLAAAKDAETDALLKKVVFVAYISVNPDGRDRYAYWYNSVAKSVVGTDPAELEHDAPWPNGRTNHYWFDLNRDWIWGVHPEMRGLTGVYQEWMPQLHVDYHEQGYNSNYFTMPGTTPRNKLLPDMYEPYSDTIGMANAKFFDRNKLNYFTREAFDFFYPGYGSSYPSVNGAIGMLTEQGGIGAGRAVETNDGYVLTFRQRIYDHYNTSLATINKAVEHKQMFQRYTYEANNPANSKSDVKAYVFPDNPKGHLYDVLSILLHHKIEVYKTKETLRLKKAARYPDRVQKSYSIPAGSFVVPTDQARHLLINSILLQDMAIEDSVMYDMSTWSAPLAYNLDTYAVYEKASMSLERLNVAPKYPKGLKGSVENAYAFVIDGDQRNAPKALSMLWQHNYRVRVATVAFSPDGRSFFPEGSLVILAGRNLDKADKMASEIEEIALQSMVEIHALSTGRMKSGVDLASNRVRPIHPPKAAMLVDNPFNTYSAGFIYHLFDKDVAFPLDRIRAGSLKQSALSGVSGSRYGAADLLDYDVLVLPPASRLDRVFDKNSKFELMEWVRNGGTLVLNGSSAAWFASDSSLSGGLMKKQTSQKDLSEAENLNYSDRERFRGLDRIPGAAMLTNVDGSDPLAFGMPDHFYSLKFSDDSFKPSERLYSAARYEKDVSVLMSAGYASKDNLSDIAGGTMAGTINMGSGKVILLADDTQYRMFWRGGQRMMINAVMWGGMK